MRRLALLLLAASGCSFDASGFGEPPATSNTTSASSTTMGSATGESSGGGSEPTTSETGVGPGSDSLSGTSSGSGEVTTEPGTATTGGTDATTGGTTTGTSATTTTGTTGEPCETMMAYVDADGDMYGDPDMPTQVCMGQWNGVADNGDDCDDAAPNTNPGASETCDGLDNDCDTIVDEYDAVTNNDKCDSCTFRVRDKRLYYFCTDATGWDSARAFCTARKLDLAIDSDNGEHDWLVPQIDALSDWGALWWIGGRENDGFKWVDGSKVPSDARWYGGEPNDQSWPLDFGADCMVLTAPGPAWGGKWIDWDCADDRLLICEGPEP